ncbi:MAG: HAMP domain-containing protein [Chloroflexi bacterium]|nr:HAMP domain-containing protein [Ktedonobacteraceae bacterium]MBV9019327.1 HAMP domain-containing protein [Ktedonobacteraceae bacterium]MBV9706776.1 HAMP domain-containing protein [Chloroflexota bacterium]
MNPERGPGRMTVNALMQLGLVTSTALPVIFIALLGFTASQLDKTTFLLVVIACAIIVLLGVLIVNYFVQRRIKDRLLGLVDVCRDYNGGDQTVRASVNGDDEFAMLSMSLNTLLDAQSSPAANTALASSSSDAAALQAQIEKLLQEVSAVGDGDLRIQAEVTPDTLGVLADSFNYMIEELAKVVGRVQATAVQVTNATRRILDRSGELAQASEAQATQISQTTEEVEALAVFIQNVAHNAQLSAETAQEALRNANSGQQSVRQTIEGMMLIRENVQETAKKIKRLGERSNEIGEIVRIIEDIADQTNLLALNAAIQSAMAGEHGRGFAVVADEIRLLAERSTESTKRIATLVKSIQGDTYEAVVAMEDSTQEVVKGSQLADEAGRSLNSIYSAVERQAQMIEGIARSANEQTSVSESVAVAMSQISEITQQTNAGAQEATVSVSYLAELAEQLRASVSTFRLPESEHEMMAALSATTSVTELAGNTNEQLLAPTMTSGIEGDWSQNGPNVFSSLPEPGNSGSMVSLTSRTGQFIFKQQDLRGQFNLSAPPGNQFQQAHLNFGEQQPLGNPSGAIAHQPFPSQDGLLNQQQYNQPLLGARSRAQQQDFVEMSNLMSNFEHQEQQPFGPITGFESQSQPTYQASNQLPPPLQSGQSVASHRRRNIQQQSPFDQDPFPFQNNGQPDE